MGRALLLFSCTAPQPGLGGAFRASEGAPVKPSWPYSEMETQSVRPTVRGGGERDGAEGETDVSPPPTTTPPLPPSAMLPSHMCRSPRPTSEPVRADPKGGANPPKTRKGADAPSSRTSSRPRPPKVGCPVGIAFLGLFNPISGGALPHLQNEIPIRTQGLVTWLVRDRAPDYGSPALSPHKTREGASSDPP